MLLNTQTAQGVLGTDKCCESCARHKQADVWQGHISSVGLSRLTAQCVFTPSQASKAAAVSASSVLRLSGHPQCHGPDAPQRTLWGFLNARLELQAGMAPSGAPVVVTVVVLSQPGFK